MNKKEKMMLKLNQSILELEAKERQLLLEAEAVRRTIEAITLVRAILTDI